MNRLIFFRPLIGPLVLRTRLPQRRSFHNELLLNTKTKFNNLINKTLSDQQQQLTSNLEQLLTLNTNQLKELPQEQQKTLVELLSYQQLWATYLQALIQQHNQQDQLSEIIQQKEKQRKTILQQLN